ncbi:TIGR00725 family protein [Wenjunlia tyrosinilytica]|uniref:TIGR00725 family protein n=1 Tax=Wenjunlia tyrosinilytica TaxID=1544741 RepID=A0A917ZT79_9ACTN|nr:TIGR00725 family protein [Wenjunlia tyrosinilytica]
MAVCGPSVCTPEEAAAARSVGELLAAAGAVVLCGGYGGVMEAAAEGAARAGGLVIGVLSGADRTGANRELSAAIVTGMGQARNHVLVASADAVIAVGGSWGTLSEVAMAVRSGSTPVIGLGGWRVLDAGGTELPGPRQASSPEEAVGWALES